MKKFSECTIWLYGYTQKAQALKTALKRNGYQVNGYIDRKAAKYRESNNDVIFSPEEISPRENEIILIMLLSITSQIEVAKTMKKYGWKHILWGASGEEYSSSYKNSMIKNYNRVLNLDFETEIEIEEYEERTANEEIIKSYGNHVVVYVPLELLFCSTKETILSINTEFLSEKWENIFLYAGKNIVRLKLYRDYFNMMFWGSSDAEEYLETYSAISNRTVNEYLKDRMELFHIWEHEYHQNGISYFVNSAASVVWDDRNGRFYILDGIHRIMYLIYKGVFHIPVKMTQQDFILWKNSQKYNYYSPKHDERRSQQLCFTRILDKIDLDWLPFHTINKIIVISKNNYWAEILKDNIPDSETVHYNNLGNMGNFQLRENNLLYFIEHECPPLNLISKIEGDNCIIFLLIDKNQINHFDNIDILFQNYNKKLLCIKRESIKNRPE